VDASAVSSGSAVFGCGFAALCLCAFGYNSSLSHPRGEKKSES
jgi:hypothetical protein